MKLVSYTTKKKDRLGIYLDGKIYDVEECAAGMGFELPRKMRRFLESGDESMNLARQVEQSIKEGKITSFVDDPNLKLLAPIPNPTSCRDGYAFRQHVQTARRNRGIEMIPEFDQYPVFYFTNHNAIFGEGEIRVEDDHLRQLDFELEVAVVIGKEGRNISVDEADNYIAGYLIMNDFSARVLQMEEMKLNLGPAKGKDFATTIGPWLVTPDELEQYKISSEFGNKYDLRMTAKHNGKQISDGNVKDMNWTFAEIIERASYGVRLLPGDVIGSGTVGTGCYLELNGTWALEAKEKGTDFTPVWLNDGDEIELEITGLGILKNTIRKAKKKPVDISKEENLLMLHYEPKDLSVLEVHKLLLGGVAPRPIALVSTISKDGINNLSPFSFFNAFGANPPVVAFSPSRRGKDATLKDTYNNLNAVKECVIQAVTYSMVEQVSLASAEYAPDVDEFIKSGLTPVDSDIVKPKRVKESPFQMECRLLEMKSFGEGGASANLAVCEVIKFHVAEDLFTNGIIDPLKIDLVARMSGDFYTRAGSGIFIVEKPIGKKCIGFDQIPKYIRESEIYSANDLGKFGNSETIPDTEEVNRFIHNIINETPKGFTNAYSAFLECQEISDYQKMLQAALSIDINKKENLELTAKCALGNNDIDFAWKVAIFAGNY